MTWWGDINQSPEWISDVLEHIITETYFAVCMCGIGCHGTDCNIWQCPINCPISLVYPLRPEKDTHRDADRGADREAEGGPIGRPRGTDRRPGREAEGPIRRPNIYIYIYILL